MNRREFIEKLGLSVAGTALITNKLTANSYTTIDDAIIKTSNNPEDYTTREVRDHNVDRSYAGAKLKTTLNDNNASSLGWELLGYSSNLDNLDVVISGNILGSRNNTVLEDAGKQYQLIYRALDEGSQNSGIVRVVDEEIDRYKTEFTIDYIDNTSGTPQQYQVTFEAPNSVTKMLMGWNPDDPIVYNEETQLSPASTTDLFLQYFNNLQNLLHNEENAMGLSRIVNRNTPVPVGDPNPVYGKLSLIDAISQGDVTQQDDLYPGLVTLNMVNFGP